MYSGFGGKLELLLVIPDRATFAAALSALQKLRFQNYKHIQDSGKGKPQALNLAISAARGETVIFSDGDVYLARNSVQELIRQLDQNPELGAVTGRQLSIDSRRNMFGYFSHLFADALDHVRKPMQGTNPSNVFFPLSGYVMAVRRGLLNFELPQDVLVDDGYISCMVYNQGFRIGYNPKAAACVSYPKNSEDYFKQKIRSTGGYLQLKKYGVVRDETKSRGIKQDLNLFLFPLRYARGPKELIWSVLLYGLRFNLWLRIFLLRIFRPGVLFSSWKRVESTK
jgi:cellulose synthase/poly-beta-1,6-N-acetylglucosamine synthase-like glycosyltransferase